MDRRERIADAGIALIAREGMRALTHRGVDAEAGLSAGSTSYYARSRRELVVLVVDRLSDRSQEDLAEVQIPSTLDVETATALIVNLLERMAKREDAQAARFMLLFELRNDEALRLRLTEQAPVRAGLVSAAEELLVALGAHGRVAPRELVAFVDALLMYRASRAARFDARIAIRSYLQGVCQ
jgi:AcrR family transcriptional regulator